MRFTVISVSFITLYGCGIECSKTDRTGTYRVTYAEKSGDCGAIDDAIVRLDGSEADVPDGCDVTLSSWSDDECSYDSTMVCELQGDDLRLEGTAVTTQEDEDAAKMKGTYDVTLKRLSTGDLLCHSLYESTATRL